MRYWTEWDGMAVSRIGVHYFGCTPVWYHLRRLWWRIWLWTRACLSSLLLLSERWSINEFECDAKPARTVELSASDSASPCMTNAQYLTPFLAFPLKVTTLCYFMWRMTSETTKQVEKFLIALRDKQFHLTSPAYIYHARRPQIATKQPENESRKNTITVP